MRGELGDYRAISEEKQARPVHVNQDRWARGRVIAAIDPRELSCTPMPSPHCPALERDGITPSWRKGERVRDERILYQFLYAVIIGNGDDPGIPASNGDEKTHRRVTPNGSTDIGARHLLVPPPGCRPEASSSNPDRIETRGAAPDFPLVPPDTSLLLPTAQTVATVRIIPIPGRRLSRNKTHRRVSLRSAPEPRSSCGMEIMPPQRRVVFSVVRAVN
jgi:hypothetical protein